MVKAVEPTPGSPSLMDTSGSARKDAKYRLIIVASQRSKQLQRGARPRVNMDMQRHKPTRIALEEVQQGLIDFEVIDQD